MAWEITPDKYFEEAQILTLFSRLQELVDSTQREVWIKCWMLTEILMKTGIRISEAQNIKHCDIQLEGSQPKLHIRNGKGSKSRYVPIGDAKLRKHISQYTAWKKLIIQGCGDGDYYFQSRYQAKYSVAGLQRLFKAGLKQAGLDKFSCHSCRHTFATVHYQRHRNILMTSRILGHSSINTTMVYAHSNFNDMLQSTDGLYQ